MFLTGLNWDKGSTLYVLVCTANFYGGKKRTATQKRAARECTGRDAS